MQGWERKQLLVWIGPALFCEMQYISDRLFLSVEPAPKTVRQAQKNNHELYQTRWQANPSDFAFSVFLQFVVSKI